MIDLEDLVKRGLCTFDEPWVGVCGVVGFWHPDRFTEEYRAKHPKWEKEPPGRITTPGLRVCDIHARNKCVVCKAPATTTCDRAIGMVCGFPLCPDHKHKHPGDSDV